MSVVAGLGIVLLLTIVVRGWQRRAAERELSVPSGVDRVGTHFGPRQRDALRIGPYLAARSPIAERWSMTGMAAAPGSSPLQSAPRTAASIPWLRREWTTGPQRFLLIGDSEAGGLLQPFNDYAIGNGHTLSVVFTWFSATSLNFGLSTKVDTLLHRHRPTMVIVVLGMNELYARDLAGRLDAARRLRDKIGHLPYLWVGPANFAGDHGINAVFEESADPGRFLRSADMPLSRGPDRRHPDMAGYRVWMDSIAAFMIRHEAFRFAFSPPRRRGQRFTGTLVMANAVKDRGY